MVCEQHDASMSIKLPQVNNTVNLVLDIQVYVHLITIILVHV